MINRHDTAARPAGPVVKGILIIKPSSLGDIVHALPVLAAVRQAHPEARVAWIVNNGFAPLLECHPLLSEVIRFDRDHFGRMWRSPRAFVDFWQFVASVRRKRFDLVIDLQGLIRSGLLSFFSGARQRIGFADAREGAWLFYSQRVRCPPTVGHAVEKNLAVARTLGAAVDEPEFPLGLMPAERSAAQRLLTEAAGELPDSFTAVIPGARWETKRWPAERIAALIDRMQAEGLPRCVLLGGPGDRAFADRVVAACRSGVVDLVGRTGLRELTALIDLADRVVCHDSGPMHIAAALGKPTVAIFGPTSPARTGPYSGNAVVVAHPVDCGPCYERVCPHGHHRCLRELDVDTVLAQVRALGAPRSSLTASPPA
jgi:lipopolysaccharide heptosyltransferase I